MNNFGNKLSQNPSVEFDNFKGVINKFVDSNTQNSQAAQWIVQDITENINNFTGKKWTFEIPVTNANGNISYIDPPLGITYK